MIRLSGLAKSVHQSGGGRRAILRDVSLTVPTACLYGLIGPGASGKSVLLKMITALMRPCALQAGPPASRGGRAPA